jgi:hypothetical protein
VLRFFRALFSLHFRARFCSALVSANRKKGAQRLPLLATVFSTNSGNPH